MEQERYRHRTNSPSKFRDDHRDSREYHHSSDRRYRSRSRSRERNQSRHDFEDRRHARTLNNPRDDYYNENRYDNNRQNQRPVFRDLPVLKADEKLQVKNDDPRVDPKSGLKRAKVSGGGRNTESFDPRDTLVRPALRVIVGPNRETYDKKLKHDDVIVVPELFCKEEDWSIYYKLVEEIRQLQDDKVKNSEFLSWHEGAHLIVKDPTQSKTFMEIQNRIAQYFGIEQKSIGTRFNWYRDSSDFKPFHHDSAAFNPQRARNQNITVGISFGATRELAFLHTDSKIRTYFPQTNGMLFSFGRDVNIRWKHGINALPEEEQTGKGRISIVLWGLAKNCIEEADSPGILTDNTRGNGHSVHAYR